jgi:hypothetical protein
MTSRPFVSITTFPGLRVRRSRSPSAEKSNFSSTRCR